MLLAAVMAMVLAAAAPAFAQANAVGGSVQYVDCDQIQAAATGQYNTNNQQDLAGVAQELGVSQNQVLACLGSIAAGRDVKSTPIRLRRLRRPRPLRVAAAVAAPLRLAVAVAAWRLRFGGFGGCWRLASRARVAHRCWRSALVPC